MQDATGLINELYERIRNLQAENRKLKDKGVEIPEPLEGLDVCVDWVDPKIYNIYVETSFDPDFDEHRARRVLNLISDEDKNKGLTFRVQSYKQIDERKVI